MRDAVGVRAACRRQASRSRSFSDRRREGNGLSRIASPHKLTVSTIKTALLVKRFNRIAKFFRQE